MATETESGTTIRIEGTMSELEIGKCRVCPTKFSLDVIDRWTDDQIECCYFVYLYKRYYNFLFFLHYKHFGLFNLFVVKIGFCARHP